MGGVRIIYSEKYTLPLGDHVFPAGKYRSTRDRLVEQALCAPGSFVAPPAAQDDEIALVHTREYIDKLRHGGFSRSEILQMEVPYSRELAEAFWIATGGTIEACRQALVHGCAITLCGGFHHAFPDHGEGFCLVNDVAVAVRALQRSGEIRTAMTVDCDVHQGNGTAHIFRDDPSVFTLSVHQLWNYPLVKPPSDLDIDLEDRTGDAEYLLRLSRGLDEALGTLRPDLLIYLAGADPYEEDQLGGLAVTLGGLEARDRLVFEKARALTIPIAVTLAGGYARRVGDTVTIHVNTVKAALESFACPSHPP